MLFVKAGKLRCIAIAVGLALSLGAADFQTGMDAYHRGDFANAMREWQPIAEQGDPQAQFNMGLLCARGQGGPQDYACTAGLLSSDGAPATCENAQPQRPSECT